jgi:hypothetical protein
MAPSPITSSARLRRSLVGAALVVVFALGLVAGAQLCAPPPPAPEIVLAPCDCPAPAPAPAAPALKRPPAKGLPPAPPPDPEQHRQGLLAWVRGRSPELSACRGPGKTQARISVTIVLAHDRAPQSATASAAPGEVAPETLSCVRTRVAAWQLPAELTAGRRELIFGLTL